MAKGKSGRIVIEVDPNLKRRLHSELSLIGKSMKSWFISQANLFLGGDIPNQLDEEAGWYGVSAKRIGTLTKDKVRPTVVSMFSGCGGMDLGFMGGFESLGVHFQEHPFNIVWANDFNPAACQTYESNLNHNIHVGDVWDHLDTLPDSVDVVIGGFPCQDISVNGKRAGIAGKRSGLYLAMIEAIKRTRPKVFVAENVKGLLMEYNKESLDQVYNDFSSLGYNVAYQLYNAADFGVPQLRERVFIVGTRPDVGKFNPPLQTHTKLDWITAESAISDLERADENKDLSHIWSRAKKSPEQGNRKLTAHRPGHTIRAECHGNIQFHYKLNRRISMREAARIQSFPDVFIFKSGLRETERQIGNAVPPVLAWHIAGAVARCLDFDHGTKSNIAKHQETNAQMGSNLELEHQLA